MMLQISDLQRKQYLKKGKVNNSIFTLFQSNAPTILAQNPGIFFLNQGFVLNEIRFLNSFINE